MRLSQMYSNTDEEERGKDEEERGQIPTPKDFASRRSTFGLSGEAPPRFKNITSGSFFFVLYHAL